jgi:hypothetical protein
MPSFLAGSFAIAGAIAALGPVLIHLLSRRRYRDVPWGAMELLKEAALRTRRSLRLRDLLLLVLRTACVLMFGLALARPYFSAGESAADPRQPVHAILIIDNSLSMGYGDLGGTLLERAVSRAVEFVDRLPDGSRISILPLCGPDELIGRDAYYSSSDAREALEQIQVMDRAGTVNEAIDLARQASDRVRDPASRRIVFLSDQQKNSWPAAGLETELKSLPEFQIVPVQATEIENSWIDSLHVQDGFADTQSPTVLVAMVRHEGPGPRRGVRVSLEIEGSVVADEIVDLAPGQSRQVRFTHRFSEPAQGTIQSFVPAVVALTPDRLPADDTRALVVPVVAGLPVVFVDQYGAEGENPRQNLFGETYPLRKLLAPGSGQQGSHSSAIGVRHVTIDRLDRSILQDARLVVVAGVESPGAAVPLLREFVMQGGALLIAAGGRFSPVAWTDTAWRDGAGILPAPFQPEFAGHLPETAKATLDPFLLAPATMDQSFFEIDGASREELDDLYRTPVFFQAAIAQIDDATRQAIDNHAGVKSDTPPARWLQWQTERNDPLPEQTADTMQGREHPRVIARFSNQHPFLIRWQLGQGTILVATSGIGSNWNNLARTNAILLFDRLLRQLLADTLPRRNFETFEQPQIPVAAAQRRAEVRLERPEGASESLPIDALGPDRFGIVVRHLDHRGLYRLIARRASDPAGPAGADLQQLWQLPLAANGPAHESDLAVLDETTMRERIGDASVAWVPSGEAIRLEGAQVEGQGFWQWLLRGSLCALLAEMAYLRVTRPRLRRSVADAGNPATKHEF